MEIKIQFKIFRIIQKVFISFGICTIIFIYVNAGLHEVEEQYIETICKNILRFLFGVWTVFFVYLLYKIVEKHALSGENDKQGKPPFDINDPKAAWNLKKEDAR